MPGAPNPTSTPPRPAGPCPCGRGLPYAACCGPLHRGEATAATAELLMRSRYSAFAVGNAAHLLATWHPSTRPPALELEPGRRWTGLQVLATTGGGFLDAEGTVEFTARSAEDGGAGGAGRPEVQHEVSRFVREGGRWLYVGPAGPTR